MENNKYPTIKNGLLLILLYVGISNAFVAVIGVIGGILSIGIDSPIHDILYIIVKILGYLLIFKIGIGLAKRPFNEIFKFNMIPGVIWAFFVITMVGFTIILFAIANLIHLVLPMPPFLVNLFEKLIISKNIVLSIIIVAIIPPIFEEMFFRGLLVDGFKRNYTLSKTIFVSSLLFGLIHMNPWQFVTAFLLGIFFSWICIKTNSILLPILGHFLNNFIVLIVSRYSDQLSIPDNITGAFQPLWLYALGVFLFVSGLIPLWFRFRKTREVDAQALFNLGHTYVGAGRYGEAIAAFKRSIAQKPDDAWVYNDLGFVYARLSRWREATEAYKQAIRLNPDFAYAHLHLRVAYFRIRNKENALEEYKILRKSNPGLADKFLKMIRA